MCGIAGYFGPGRAPEGGVAAMLAAMRHRGPDASVSHADGPFQAGMCRLAINGLRSGGQPLYNEDRSVALFYNGEIYNSPALRAELEADGARLNSASDGAVIPHLYARHGLEAFARLDGMYACALWDRTRRRLVLARDIPGEKPLHYVRTPDGGLVFASEIKALRAYPGLELRLDLQALWDFPTFLWIPEPRTVYQGVAALPRGHLLVAQEGRERLLPIPNLFAPARYPRDPGRRVAMVRDVVTRAVTSRLLSEVPVGCFLSGGLDSSIIATLAASRLDRLTTFTVAFEDIGDPYHGRADESPFARATARRLGVRHEEIRVTGRTFRDALPDFVRYGDQPFGVSSGLGILAVSRRAREMGVKVLLSGDCADECFGGYSWYRWLALGYAPPGDGRPPCPMSMQSTGRPLRELLAGLRTQPAPLRAWAWHYYASEADKARLFHPDVGAAAASSLRHFEAFDPSPVWKPEAYVRQDRCFYMPFEMLRKVDRMTMAHSVEGRPPFAAPEILGLAELLPWRDMVRGGTLKAVLRQAFADVLPPEVLSRPKHGFNVPIDHWLRGEWSDLVTEAFAPDSALARHGLIRATSGREALALLREPGRLNGHTVFCYLMLNLWLERVHD
jgi:asparagine synthase (glutamine-hydrolysing)